LSPDMLSLPASARLFPYTTLFRSQIGEDLARVAAHRVGRLGAVGHPRRVAEINHRLVRQALEHRAGDGESPDPGIEHAERGRVQDRKSTRLNPVTWPSRMPSSA